MGSLLHPVGSQPASVYWLRRAIVLVVGLAVIAGLAFLFFRPAPPAPVAAVPVTSAPSASTTPTPTPSVSPTSTPTPTGPLVCDQTNTEIRLAGYQKVKQGGKQPFKVALSNSGSQNCVLDVKPDNFSLTVTSGSDRIWSTDDCAKWVPTKKQTLKPGKSYEFTVEWQLVRSASGCKTTKDIVKPGTYVGKATFGIGKEARQVFTVAKK